MKCGSDQTRHLCADPLAAERPGLYVRSSGVLVTPFAVTRRGLGTGDAALVEVLADAVTRNLDRLPPVAWVFPDADRPPAACGGDADWLKRWAHDHHKIKVE